jgi:hypothetical protein
MSIYEYIPGDTETWVLPAKDVKIHEGATLVAYEDLQSSSFASILLLGPEAIVETRGDKGRGSSVETYVRGVRTITRCVGDKFAKLE